MARVTVEDCILKIPNRFDLVLQAAQRARNISAGSHITLDRDNDKNPVVALREIADETIDFSELQESLIRSQQKFAAREESDEDEPEFDVMEGELESSATQLGSVEVVENNDEESGLSLEDIAEREANAEAAAVAEEGDDEER